MFKGNFTGQNKLCTLPSCSFYKSVSNCNLLLFTCCFCIMLTWTLDKENKKTVKAALGTQHLIFHSGCKARVKPVHACACVLREPFPGEPPTVCRGSAELQTGPRQSVWQPDSVTWPRFSWNPPHAEPRLSVRWQQYLRKQTLIFNTCNFNSPGCHDRYATCHLWGLASILSLYFFQN